MRHTTTSSPVTRGSHVVRLNYPILAFCVLLLGARNSFAGSARAGQPPAPDQTTASSVTLRDLDGKAVDPFETKDAKARVFIFVSNDCPISNRYVPEIHRLVEEFGKRSVAFWLVNPNSDETAAAIRKHAKEYDYPCPVLRDPRHALVKRAGAKVTPEAAVFDSSGKLVYHGRIDDRYMDFGKERPVAMRHDLEEVLSDVVAGKPVTRSTARAIGCYIPD